MKLQPDLICRIVGSPSNTNRLVRTVTYSHEFDLWVCEALQSLNGVVLVMLMNVAISQDRTLKPGEMVHISASQLRPLYDGDVDEGWVERLREVPALV